MTAPTITYSHAFLTDCNSLTGWTPEASPTLTSIGYIMVDDDYFVLTGTASAANQHFYLEYDLTDVDWALYPRFLVRYKTNSAAAGLAAKVELVFSDATTQIILIPTFSTVWTTASLTISTGEPTANVSKIRLYAVSDSACGAGHQVYFDFAMIYKGTFTFPSVSGKVHFEMDNIYADLPIPSRISNASQYLGMNSSDIMLDGKIDVNTSYCSDRSYTTKITCEAAGKIWYDWGTPYGEYLMLLMQQASADPFQWFTSDMVNCKVTPRRLILDQDGEALRSWQFYLKQYSRSGGQQSTWNDLQYWGV